jgi:hypothetical protein
MDRNQRVAWIKERMVAALAAEGVRVEARAVIVGGAERPDGDPYLTVALVMPHSDWSSGDRIAREVVSKLRAEDPSGPEIHLRSFETPEEAALDKELREATKKG